MEHRLSVYKKFIGVGISLVKDPPYCTSIRYKWLFEIHFIFGNYWIKFKTT